jgi:hypothetical protein
VVRVAVDFDLALEKSTSFYDAELQLTFPAEFFNIFNHTEFQNPTTGRVTSFLRRSVESFRDEPRFEVMTGHFWHDLLQSRGSMDKQVCDRQLGMEFINLLPTRRR